MLDPPVVQCSLLRGDENLILFSGPDESGPNGKGRSDLRIRFSTDEGESWQDGPLIHIGAAAYSDMIVLDSDRYGVIFEAGDDVGMIEIHVFNAAGEIFVDDKTFFNVGNSANVQTLADRHRWLRTGPDRATARRCIGEGTRRQDNDRNGVRAVAFVCAGRGRDAIPCQAIPGEPRPMGHGNPGQGQERRG